MLYERFDIGIADAIGFCPDDLWPPVLDERLQSSALEGPADLIKAVERHHFLIGDIDDGDGGVVIITSPIDTGDIGMAGLGGVKLGLGNGLGNAAEDLSVFVGEFCFVFGLPDGFGGDASDILQFFGCDEGVSRR